MNIPIDFTHASFPPSPITKPFISNHSQDSNQPSNSRANPNENVIHYYQSNEQPRSAANFTKRLSADLSNQNRTSNERTVNELRVNISAPTTHQQQQNVPIPPDEKLLQQQQRVTK